MLLQSNITVQLLLFCDALFVYSVESLGEREHQNVAEVSSDDFDMRPKKKTKINDVEIIFNE